MNIIFVCTGNTCRSPMAEGYLKSKQLANINVTSRGFSSGYTANANAIAVMDEVGIDISDHVSSCINANDISRADAIICMTESHKQTLIASGCDTNHIYVLSGGIPDPFGCDINTYRICRNSIFAGIDALIKNGFFGKIKIRYATHDDIPDIAHIEETCFSTPWSQNAIHESMDAGTTFYTAHVGDTTVGYMGVSKVAGEGYITNIAVLPQYRRNGFGQMLLEHVINDCQDSLEFISLEVRASNVGAISLYEKLGFDKVGLRKRFYTHPDEDALIMTKTFI